MIGSRNGVVLNRMNVVWINQIISPGGNGMTHNLKEAYCVK